jgi:catechol 2,3-dioxygenase-like lactoylglutathione lyase family enzyme
MFRIEGIDHIALSVRDVERSVTWYTEVLGLTRFHQNVWGSYPAVVGAGTTALALFPVEGENAQPPPDRDPRAMRHVGVSGESRRFRAGPS